MTFDVAYCTRMVESATCVSAKNILITKKVLGREEDAKLYIPLVE